MKQSERRKEHLRDAIKTIAAGLRDMADEVERVARTATDAPEQSVERVIHLLAWKSANLSADGLVAWLREIREMEAAERAEGEGE